MNIPQSRMMSVRALYYSVLSISLTWFLFGILYGTIVQNESFIQVQPSNYVGLTATIGVILFETKIRIHRQPSYRQPKSSFEERALQLEEMMALPLRIGDCPYDIDYFDKPSRTGDIPTKCIECSNIIECACRSNRKIEPRE